MVKPKNVVNVKDSRKLKPTMKKKKKPKIENSFGIMVEGRKNVGARNPLILAANKLGLEDLSRYNSGSKIKRLLIEAFGDELEYEQLFDPQYDSPVYYGLYRATARLAESADDSELYAALLKKLHKPKGPGEIPPLCNTLIKSETQSDVINGKNVKYRDTAAGTNAGIGYDDPFQGCVADCWLISALSSVALAELKSNPPLKSITRAAPVQVYPNTLNPKDLTTEMKFFTTLNGTRPYYAYLNPSNDTNANFYEAWMCYYEKCFAGYYQNNKVPPNPPNNNPDYHKLDYQDGFLALNEITGKTVTGSTSGLTRTYFNENGIPDNVTGMITMIRNAACERAALVEGAILFTKRPAVAHTYESAGYVPALANRNTAPYAYGAAVVYSTSGLPANHAFSIIGLYLKNNVPYVALRNPWGFGGDAASFLAALRPSVIALPNLAGTKGYFGLKSLTFMRYFEEFGCTAAI